MICNKVETCADHRLTLGNVIECTNSEEKCVEYCDQRSNAKCEAGGKKYIIENDNAKILLFNMDEGIIVADKDVPNGIEKCDFLYIINSVDDTAVLVELKGIHVTKSLSQIEATYMRYKSMFGKMKHVYGRSIVSSSVPRINATPEFIKLSDKLRKNGGNLKIKEKQYIEKLSELDK